MASKSPDTIERRRAWLCGVSTATDAALMNKSFWKNATVDEKLDALRTLAEEEAMMEGYGAPARLQRHLNGVRRARS